MFSKFLVSSSGWPYANLAKMAKLYGGPQNFLNTVFYAGKVQGIAIVLVGEAVVLAAGAAINWGALNLHSMKNGKLGRKVSTNSNVCCPDVDCPECGTPLDHRSGLSDDDGYLECPKCKWSITDQEFEDGDYEDCLFGDEF